MKLTATALLMLALLAPSLHAAEPLGRLFFTPAQRNTLDAGKQLDRPKKAGPSVRGPRSVTLNGIVTRSDGESTVWVNGRALDGRTATGVSSTASGSDPAAARVKVRGARNTVQMRVGQRLERSTGRITEPYESNVNQTEAATPSGKDGEVEAGRKQTPSTPEAAPEQVSDD